MPQHREHIGDADEDLDLDPAAIDGIDIEITHRALETLADLIDPDDVKRGDIATLQFTDSKRLSISLKALDTPELRRIPKGEIIEAGAKEDADGQKVLWKARKTDDKDGWEIRTLGGIPGGELVQYDTEISKLIYCTPAALGAYDRGDKNHEQQ